MADRPLRPEEIGARIEDDDWLTVDDVMARLRLGRSTVYDLIRSHRLDSTRVGRSRRIPRSALRAFMERQLKESF